ncbi:hypothetical protein D3C85_958380 [compost metagenome]
MNEMSIREASYLPYGLFFTYLVEFFRIARTPTQPQLAEMSAWFWFTSCTLHFGGASTGDITRELINVREFAHGNRNQLFARSQIDVSRLLYDKFSLKNASSTAFALLLLSIRPNLTLSGKPIDLDVIGEKNSKVFGRLAPADLTDLNISVVLDPHKRRQNLGIQEELLSDHLLNNECIAALENDDTEIFVNSRSAIISELVEGATGCRTTYNYETFSYNPTDWESEDTDD